MNSFVVCASLPIFTAGIKINLKLKENDFDRTFFEVCEL